MKRTILLAIVGIVALAFVAGCEQKTAEDASKSGASKAEYQAKTPNAPGVVEGAGGGKTVEAK